MVVHEPAAAMSFLYDQQGKRKYLTAEERREFLRVARITHGPQYTFCATLALTGARISEVLELLPCHWDLQLGTVVIRSLKKRQVGVYRCLPVPKMLCQLVEEVHDLGRARWEDVAEIPLWPWCRTTAWKVVKSHMVAAGLQGPYAVPKGLRHSFAVGATGAGVPLQTVRKWMGHARIETTAIYTDAIGHEERQYATLNWRKYPSL